ncbi:MAG: hypothetical protein EBU90_06470 [Proteobacteria bacterium]|nr:hypothetical protein [Pseudomonadota bacterium]NBP13562.1 hypothetical protein [bacterium]
MNGLGRVFLGTIEKILPPDNTNNFYKYQYVYKVKISMNGFSQVPVNCVLSEKYGSKNNFDDHVLELGARVLVVFLNYDTTLGVIIGAVRLYDSPTDVALGQHYKKRFNRIEEFISKDNNYSLTSLSGPNFHLNTDSIVLDDASQDKITIDKTNKKITIECQTWNVEVKGNATINVGGNATVSANNVNVTASGNTNLNSSGTTNVTASNINLNGSSGAVMTDTLNPVVDLITGVPSIGVKNVKSG